MLPPVPGPKEVPAPTTAVVFEPSSWPPSISVVVPTYREAQNLPLLIERLAEVRRAHGYLLDLWVMDDDSQDGSAQVVQRLGYEWVTLVRRRGLRGLSLAVLDGLGRAAGEVLVVMDADLSHPPEAIPRMLATLREGADFVLGSRFVEGGTTDDDWGMFRWLNSRVATLLALPLTTVRDPMSGFFMLHRTTFESGFEFNPVGYKIGLELYVKCGCRKAVEVPIHFADRRRGTSKLTFREQLRYLQHIRRLYMFRFEAISQVAHFLLVGLSGLVVNLVLLTGWLWLGVAAPVAMVLAIALSMVWNFILNRRFSFSYAQDQAVLPQFLGFVSACSLGAFVNYLVSLVVLRVVGTPQLAALVGTAGATGFNFLASRLYVFKQRHVVGKQRQTRPTEKSSGAHVRGPRT